MNGQLNFETSVLGKYIVDIVKQEDVKSIVEIGTLSGMGSTRCILEGLKGRTNYLFHSYECWDKAYNEAIQNNKKFIGDKFKIILGKIVNEDDVREWVKNQEENEWVDGQELRTIEREWLRDDLKNMYAVENVFLTVPSEIDFLLLDGGEFSTYLEFSLLRDRTKVIALDDTKTRKCKKIKEELLQSDAEVMLDSDERNGVAIFKL